MLAPESDGGANMLTRMVQFCEEVDEAEARREQQLLQHQHDAAAAAAAAAAARAAAKASSASLPLLQRRGLLGLALSCLNIVRLKATEVRARSLARCRRPRCVCVSGRGAFQ